MARYELVATARASFYVYSTPEDVDALVAALHLAREVFGV
jgi:cysteine desulfurase/selenocysteine lyase